MVKDPGGSSKPRVQISEMVVERDTFEEIREKLGAGEFEPQYVRCRSMSEQIRKTKRIEKR